MTLQAWFRHTLWLYRVLQDEKERGFGYFLPLVRDGVPGNLGVHYYGAKNLGQLVVMVIDLERRTYPSIQFDVHTADWHDDITGRTRFGIPEELNIKYGGDVKLARLSDYELHNDFTKMYEATKRDIDAKTASAMSLFEIVQMPIMH